MADYTQTVRRSPAIEAAQEQYIDLLTQQVGRAPGSTGVPTLGELGPQVAGQNVLTQAAQQQAASQAGLGQLTFGAEGQVTGVGQGTGVSGYQPYLTQAGQYSGPQAYQQFMSPYQQDIIDTTLAEFDVQTAQGVPQLAANAITAGAYGGGRDAIANAQYASDAARNRAQLQASMLGQGFTQANQLAQQNMMNQLGLGSAQQGFLGQDVGALSTLGAQNQALAQAQLSAQQQLAQQQANQKLQAAQTLGAGITGLISGYPGQTTTQSSPSPTLAQTALGTGATLAGIYRGFGLGQ